MKVAVTLFLFLFITCIFSCSDKSIPIIEKGNFEINIDGKAWAPINFNAVWFTNYKHLYLSAHDVSGQFTVGISVDPVSPLKTYILEPNGHNSASFTQAAAPGHFSTDNNVPNNGGTFTLTAFDTVKKLVSCSFQFNSFSNYNSNYNSMKSIVSSSLVNLPLIIDSLKDEGNSLECIVKGVNTVSWMSHECTATPQCDNSLEISFRSLAGVRYLMFRIPLGKGIGTHNILPDYPPSSVCGKNNIISRYVANSYENAYFATSGTINITKLDIAAKKMDADFNIVCKDTSAMQQTVQITNGKLHLNTWK